MSDKPKTWPARVRTTITPTETVEATEREWDDLSRQGLLFAGNATEAKAAQDEANGSSTVFETFTALPPDDQSAATPIEGTEKKGA